MAGSDEVNPGIKSSLGLLFDSNLTFGKHDQGHPVLLPPPQEYHEDTINTEFEQSFMLFFPLGYIIVMVFQKVLIRRH